MSRQVLSIEVFACIYKNRRQNGYLMKYQKFYFARVLLAVQWTVRQVRMHARPAMRVMRHAALSLERFERFRSRGQTDAYTKRDVHFLANKMKADNWLYNQKKMFSLEYVGFPQRKTCSNNP